MEKVNNKDANTPCYQIRPLKSDDTEANIYLNWLYGPNNTSNPLNGTVSVGVYGEAATSDAGSGWSLVTADAATDEQIANAKSIIRTGIGYPKTTSAAYIALNGLTTGASIGDVENAKNNYIACTDISLPEEGHAYKLSMVSKDGTKTWALVASGTTLTPTLGGSATTFYCHKINNGNDRFVFIAANGNILAYHALTTNYDNLYATDACLVNDFAIEALASKNTNSYINSTKEQRFGYVTLTNDDRYTNKTDLGCFILTESNGTYAAANGPFHNGTYTSAVKIEEVNGDNINNSNQACIAKTKIDALVSGYKYRNYYGKGYCHYTITDLRGTTYTWAEHNSAIGNAADNTEIPVFRYTLNMPQAGSFLRIKGANTQCYITGNGTSGQVVLSNAQDENTILYYDGSKLIGYKNGRGFSGTHSVAQVGTFENHTFSVSPYRLDLYMIKSNYSGSQILTDGGSAQDLILNRWATENHIRSAWSLEEVTSLPVTIASLKFATFCSPVPVTIPDAVTAYAATLSGNTITLYELPTKVIPANCGVLLHADAAGTYNFAIGGSAEQIYNNILTGTVPAIVAPENAYTLQKTQGAETCAFYSKAAGSTIAGFKSYIVSDSGNSRLSFSIEGEDETGIGSIVNKKANGDGMFIIDGKIVIIKNGVKYNVNGIRY